MSLTAFTLRPARGVRPRRVRDRRARDSSTPTQVERLRERFEAIFREEYETGIRPDEVNWVAGRDPENRTRQICNGWKADTALAEQVLSEHTGRLAPS